MGGEERLKQDRDKTYDLLENLRRLNEELASLFCVKDISLKNAPLRLLFTEDSAVAKDQTTPADSFIIISYRGETKRLARLTFGPSRKKIAESIKGLRHAKEGDTWIPGGCNEGVWIDEVCIDQKDNSQDGEKSNLISLINYIYWSARQAVIVLGDVTVTKAEEDAANRWFDYARNKDNIYPGRPGWEFILSQVPQKESEAVQSRPVGGRERGVTTKSVPASLTIGDFSHDSVFSLRQGMSCGFHSIYLQASDTSSARASQIRNLPFCRK